MGATMADSAIIRCKRRKQANPQRKNVDIDGNPKGMTPAILADGGNNPISPSPENGYHSNSSTIEDSDGEEKGSFMGDDLDDDIDDEVENGSNGDKDDGVDDMEPEKAFHRSNGHHPPYSPPHPHQFRKGEVGADGVINLEDYMNRSDTAIIYPEPVEDMDTLNGETDNPNTPEGNDDNETEIDGELGKPEDCPYCDRSYKRLTSLKEHIKYRHEKTFNNFSCPECNYCFAYKSQLERHMATHMPGRNQICDICNKTFVNIYRLQRHMLTHTSGNRKFKCGECGKAFKYKHHLKEHLRIHSGEKPYECPTCLKRFSHSGSYSSHISSKKCSPVKEQPPALSRLSGVPPVKVINRLPSPVLQSPISDIDTSEPRPHPEPKNGSTAYMTPLHIKIPNADGSVQEQPNSETPQENGNTTPLTSPANDAVKKVLQIVASTVCKQQKDGQKTDISKLKKTKTIIDTPPVVASPFEIRPFKLEKMAAVTPLPKAQLPPAEKTTPDEPEKPKTFVNGNGVHQEKKNYNIVDYTLKKVHEAQAINRCLESRFPSQINLNPDRTGCKYCGREFHSPIDLHQHERYLCDLNEDVLKMKLFNGAPQPQQNIGNFTLDRYYEMQQEFLSQHNHEENDHKKDGKNVERETQGENDKEMTSPHSESADQTTPKASPNTGNPSSPCRAKSPEPEPEPIKTTDITKLLETISKAQEQALRAFYAMQAKPSDDGIEKISVALNLPMQLVNKWFQHTRKLEEEGSDPSLKSLSLMRQSPVVTVVPPTQHIKEHTGAQAIDSKETCIKSPAENCDLETASVKSSSSAGREGDADSLPPSPCSSIVSLPKEPVRVTYHKEKSMDVSTAGSEAESRAHERFEPMDRDSRSPSRSVTPTKQRVDTTPLDLSMPKRKSSPPPPLGRSSIAPKLVYGYNYSALYSAAAAASVNGYLLPSTYAPPETLPSSLYENSIKAHKTRTSPSPKTTTPSSTATTTTPSASDTSLLLKRSYPDPLYAYLPTMGGYAAAKRMRFADGVDYPVAPPPVYGSHLQVPDVYSALAKTGFMPSTMAHLGAAYGPTNPFLPAMLNGGVLPPNHAAATDNSSDIASEDSMSDIGIGPGRRRRSDKPSRTSSGQYACSQCPKTFQKHSSLLRHVYEHSGKRPHQCKECGKAFKHKHHLMEHSRLHSGEKPYQCDRCLKKFSHSGSYSQHMNHRYSYCRRDAVGAAGGPHMESNEKEMLGEGKEAMMIDRHHHHHSHHQGDEMEIGLESTGAMIRRMEEKQIAGV